MTKLNEVKRWVIACGIGHVVSSCGGKGLFTLCSHWYLGRWDYRELPTEIPKRICRKCRQKLKTAVSRTI